MLLINWTQQRPLPFCVISSVAQQKMVSCRFNTRSRPAAHSETGLTRLRQNLSYWKGVLQDQWVLGWGVCVSLQTMSSLLSLRAARGSLSFQGLLGSMCRWELACPKSCPWTEKEYAAGKGFSDWPSGCNSPTAKRQILALSITTTVYGEFHFKMRNLT